MPTVFNNVLFESFLPLSCQPGQLCSTRDTERRKSKREQREHATLTVIAENEGGIKTTAKNSGSLHLYSLYARKWPGPYIAAAKERGKHKELRLHWTEKNAPSLCLETTKSNESYCWYRQSQLKLLCRRGGKPKKIAFDPGLPVRLLVFPWI
jgi:hypothetical protein